ncbi:hypothetical protein SAMN05192532_104272 [Alteribacillus iranensis]|uniref:Uncharacterized protein n=1 Tax=Alteribacillus iranensis TaxID=930128 RepID=A0A1I2DRW6_9BACI|nr:hypothetical protein SAMN05192532_104272 [Alteribacillus iranensis]
MHILLALCLALFNIKRQNWRYVSRYSRSIWLVILFNLLYYFLCKNYLLWDFTSKKLGTKTVRFLHIFIINPLCILLFLSHYPSSWGRQVLYNIKWIIFSLLVEWVGKRYFKMIYFTHGWNLKWSALVYAKMYTFSLLVLKKPFLTYSLSGASAIFYLLLFRVPMNWDIEGFLRRKGS